MNLRAWLNCGLALAAMGGSCLAFHALAPFPTVAEVRTKLEFFRRHKDDFDAVFVGSSRVYHQISPQIFDPVAQGAGEKMRSFNFGIDGLWPPELFFIVDEILDAKPRNLRWLFVELSPVTTAIEPGKRGTLREVYWHDWKRSGQACSKAFDEAGRAPDAHARAVALLDARVPVGLHLGLFLKNYANIGRGFDVLKTRGKPPSKKRLAKDLGPALDGYLSLPDGAPSAPSAALFEKRAAWLKKGRTKAPGDPPTERGFDDIANRIRSAGVAPIFLIPPTANRMPVFFHGKGEPAPLFAFNDPAAFPSLYRADFRHDMEHLNASGAAEFTRLLGERFVARFRTKP